MTPPKHILKCSHPFQLKVTAYIQTCTELLLTELQEKVHA
jgi:hypothetical protein